MVILKYDNLVLCLQQQYSIYRISAARNFFSPSTCHNDIIEHENYAGVVVQGLPKNKEAIIEQGKGMEERCEERCDEDVRRTLKFTHRVLLGKVDNKNSKGLPLYHNGDTFKKRYACQHITSSLSNIVIIIFCFKSPVWP